MALRTRGETVDEYAAASLCDARPQMPTPSTHPKAQWTSVGTGGRLAKGTLNIFYRGRLCRGGCGRCGRQNMATRNLSSKSGAADALTQIGPQVMVGPKVVEAALRDCRPIGLHRVGADAPSRDCP